MRILLVHNRYRQRSGEDMVFSAEKELLCSAGHHVAEYVRDNSEIVPDSVLSQVQLGLRAIWARDSLRDLRGLVQRERPDVVHFHNTFPLVSPAAYYACSEAGVPVVQWLPNYRLICPNAQLLRDGQICEDCVGRKFAWPGVWHACYRGSRAGSAAVAAMLSTHRILGTWHKAADVFIATTDLVRSKLLNGGLPADKVVVKPNFLPDPGCVGDGRGGFALFVGRLSAEKGIATLLSAWERIRGSIPLRIAGDGPLREQVARCAAGGRMEYIGQQPRQKVIALMREAAFLVFPSVWFEPFGLAIVEAFSVGLPVLASKIGSMASLVENGRTGLHFRPGDAEDLAAKVEWALAHPAEMERMRHEARAEYLTKYTPERNYELLMQIYDRVTGGKVSAESGIQGAAETRIPHAGSILS